MHVFISHRNADAVPALNIAKWLRLVGIPYYIDLEDAPLQIATNSNNAAAVVYKIESEIRKATHLLGVISSNTQGSWWVPFEIGQARNQNKKLAHIVLDDLFTLPEYMLLSHDLQSVREIAQWLFSDQSDSYMRKAAGAAHYIPRLPTIRSNRASYSQP